MSPVSARAIVRGMRTLVFVSLALSGLAAPAWAQLAVAPPIVAKEVSGESETALKPLLEELTAAGIKPLEGTAKLNGALSKCANKMSCLAGAGKAAGASHVLHTILAERDGEVLCQITVLEVATQKPAGALRAKSANNPAAVDGAIRQAAREAITTLLALESFPKPKPQLVVAPPPPPPPPPGPKPTSEPLKIPPKPSATLDIPEAAIGPTPAPPPVASAPPSPKPSPKPEIVETPPIVDGRAPTPPLEAPAKLKPAAPAPSPKAEPKPALAAKPPAVEAARPSKGLNFVAIGAVAAGAIAGGVGGAFLGMAKSDADQRDLTPQVQVDERTSLDDSAYAKQGAGIGLIAAGAAVVIAGAVLWATGVGAPDSVAELTPTVDGFLVRY